MTATMAVKICGIRRLEDARLAASLGAHAVGFVLAEGSPRRITIDDAARIAAALPAGVRRVGVFVNPTRGFVAAAQAAVTFDVLQLHGDERADDFAGLAPRLVKAVNLASEADVERAAAWPADVTPLVDSGTPARRGGTGQAADWDLAGGLARRRPIWLAGGLTPENVGEAIRRVRPVLVDVSSGVESAPGEKDADRLRAFFGAVHRADEEGA